MLSVGLVVAAILLLSLSGLPGLLWPGRGNAAQIAGTAMMGAGSASGLGGAGLAFAAAFRGQPAPSLDLAWALPLGSLKVAVDPLSAFFLCLVFVVPALGSLYGLGYWRREEQEGNWRKTGAAYGLLAGSMALVLVARDAVLFLVAWEVMALAAWFAATAESERVEVRKAGWIYLVATHVGTLCLFAMFALWRRATGSFFLDAASAMDAQAAAAIFVLAAVGFGFKAGIMPLHIWLPGAHANAPSHVSAVMSGVMLKVGVYGLVRMTGLLPGAAPWTGPALLMAGAVTGVAGIALALGQRDLKRALAYSSVENIGIVTMGIGLALVGRAETRTDWVILGLGGALLHSWNHGLFKSLLFMDAGAVIHATGTRDVERLGGLARRMPLMGALFAAGAVAIAGLPPMNGFAGEWLLYIGLFRTLGPAAPGGLAAAATAAVALAMIGALAVACFVRLLGAVFLGAPRSPAGDHAHDPSPLMAVPMLALALACAVIGLLPGLVAPFLEAAARTWAPGLPELPRVAVLAPQAWIGCLGLGILVLVLALTLGRKLWPRTARPPRRPTWDCGYAAPTTRMEYTASSFGESLAGLLSFILWPVRRRPGLKGPFPPASRHRGSQPDPVLDRGIRPLFAHGRRKIPAVRILQQGQTQLYILYILIIAIILLVLGGTGARP